VRWRLNAIGKSARRLECCSNCSILSEAELREEAPNATGDSPLRDNKRWLGRGGNGSSREFPVEKKRFLAAVSKKGFFAIRASCVDADQIK
jgi:hypothetical protein